MPHILPRPLGAPTRHYWRVLRMARATGTDLVAQRASGDLSQQDWAEMVQRCRGCGWVAGCRRWLTAQEGIAPAPDDCLNRASFGCAGAEAGLP